jgi:beta-galactosidase
MNDPSKHYVRPEGNPGANFPFVQADFDDREWETINLPHDWAIKGPFYVGDPAVVGGGMGRLPSPGVAWYRKKLDIPATYKNKSVFLDVDGAMSYAIVWLNGHLVGGWPYGYNSWRLDLTPYLNTGGENQLAIRLDNPNYSSRWYPGGGIYRHVWLTVTNPVHVAHWGTFVRTEHVSAASATIKLDVKLDNSSAEDASVEVISKIYELDAEGKKSNNAVAGFKAQEANIKAQSSLSLNNEFVLNNPRRWGPPPTQTPDLYLVVTELMQNGQLVDTYETRFGIRDLQYDPNRGLLVNGELVKIHGVNQHHDLGAIGAAFNVRAAQRQLEILRDMGCNAIRLAHNPPAPELLELTDKMGFLVVDEVFDSWERKKTPWDFHLIFPEWHEQDLRSMIRRDKNCPSVVMWSIGNEVGEQYTNEEGAAVAEMLRTIAKDEDPTRLTTASMNYAKPDMPFPAALDIISLNYQGEGIRQDPMFEGTARIRTKPQYDAFHKQFPNKVILSSETASAFSSRGVYYFPVTSEISDITRDGRGGNSKECQVSSYELHAVDFGSSADKVFASIDKHPFVAGEFVWNGFDYLGEPTPYYSSRSSYSGIIDLAGFPKDRFYLYQSRWRPDYAMVHILPHWNWPGRIGQITPVHVFTSGDEVELFLNGKSLGRKKKGAFEYRLRWDDVVYEPGELKAIAYKDGKEWAEETVKTTGEASKLAMKADRGLIDANGADLAFVTVRVADAKGVTVPTANNRIGFRVEGPGKIVATDNGDPTDMTAFPSHERNAFGGLVLVIVKAEKGVAGTIRLTAKATGLDPVSINITGK